MNKGGVSQVKGSHLVIITAEFMEYDSCVFQFLLSQKQAAFPQRCELDSH